MKSYLNHFQVPLLFAALDIQKADGQELKAS
jgi:hypothetical protein